MVKNVKCGVTAGLLLIVLSGTSMQGDEPLLEFEIPGQIRGFTISPDGKLVAINNVNHFGGEALSVWSVETGKRVIGLNILGTKRQRQLEDVRSPAFSDDGRLLAASFRYAEEVRIWNTRTWQIVKRLPVTGMTTAMSLAFSPDNKTLATGNELYGDDSTPVQSPLLWNVESGRLSKKLIMKPTWTPYSLDFSSDNKYLACHADLSLCFWQRGAANPQMHEILPLRGRVFGVEFSFDSKSVLVRTLDDVRILESGTWKESRRIDLGGVVRQVRCVPKSNLVAVVAEVDGIPVLDLYDIPSGKKSRRILDFGARYGPENAQTMPVKIACSEDGRVIVASRGSKMFSVWKVREDQ